MPLGPERVDRLHTRGCWICMPITRLVPVQFLPHRHVKRPPLHCLGHPVILAVGALTGHTLFVYMLTCATILVASFPFMLKGDDNNPSHAKWFSNLQDVVEFQSKTDPLSRPGCWVSLQTIITYKPSLILKPQTNTNDHNQAQPQAHTTTQSTELHTVTPHPPPDICSALLRTALPPVA